MIFSILRKTNYAGSLIPDAEQQKLRQTIISLEKEWMSKRDHEEKGKQCTPKFHDVFYHIMEQLDCLGRVWPWIEDPIKKLNKDDKNKKISLQQSPWF